MNMYINQQVNNMKQMVKTFQQSCEYAAMRDDGNISFSEEKVLKQIQKASTKFIKELEELK